MASDGGSGVLILRGVTGRLLSKSPQPNKVPLALKTSTDLAGCLFRRSGFSPDDAAFDEPVPTYHDAADSEESPPQAGREGGPSFVWLGVVRAQMVPFLSCL